MHAGLLLEGVDVTAMAGHAQQLGHAQAGGPTKELAVVLHGLAVEGVQHGVAGAVGGSCTPVGLPALAEVQTLPAECALVDLALVGPGEGQAVVFELHHRFGRLSAHVLDGILQQGQRRHEHGELQ